VYWITGNIAGVPVFLLSIKLPHSETPFRVQVSAQERIQDVCQVIIESPDTCMYSCFSLAFKGKRLDDFTELGSIKGFTPNSTLELVEGNVDDSVEEIVSLTYLVWLRISA
jgi:hypothetical protein